jgi:phosphatidylglycerophosphate synthase
VRNRAAHGFLKAQDSWLDVLVLDLVTIPLTRAVARIGVVSPNAVTWFGLLTRVASVALFFRDEVVGAVVLFGLGLLADGVDGKLARLTGRTSAFGGRLDYFGDVALYGVLTVAVGVGTDVSPWLYGVCAATDVTSALVTADNRLPQQLAAAPTTWRARHGLVAAPGSLETHAALFLVAPLVSRTTVVVVMVVSTCYYAAAFGVKCAGIRRLDDRNRARQ